MVVKYNNLWQVGNSTEEAVRTQATDTEAVEDTTESDVNDTSSDTLEELTPSFAYSNSYSNQAETLSNDDIRREMEDYHNRSVLREGFRKEIQETESGPDTKHEAHFLTKGGGDKVVTISAPPSAECLARELETDILARVTDPNVSTSLVTPPTQYCIFKRGGMCTTHNIQGKKHFTTHTKWEPLKNGLFGNVRVRKTNWTSMCQKVLTSVISTKPQPRATYLAEKQTGGEISDLSDNLESGGLVTGSMKRIWSEMFNTSQPGKL